MIERPRWYKRIAVPIGFAIGGQSFAYLAFGCLWASLTLSSLAQAQSQPQSPSTAPDPSHNNRPSDTGTSAPVLPRGKKLVLKDGNFQLVREYQVEGDRVRYYDIDSSEWQEIPASLVDWEATKKIEAEEAQHDAALASRIHLREQGRRAEPLDIDASFEVVPGVFLPPGEGLFLFDGHSVARVVQAETSYTTDKGRVIEKILVPIPLATRHTLSVQGPHATFRIHAGQPEFYKRSAINSAPEFQLIQAKVHGGRRDFERMDEIFGERELSAKKVPIQSWEMAPGLYRFTLGKDLAPGEYAIAEVLPGSAMEVYLWDFGMDQSGEPVAPKGK
jgi:hypothetical protein